MVSRKRFAPFYLLLGSLAACNVEDASEGTRATTAAPPPAAEAVKSEGTEMGPVRIDSPETAERAAAQSGIEGPYSEALRPNAEGEPVRVFVPAADPVIEVPEGTACGTKDELGRYRSCLPGTYCMKASENAPSICQAAPSAPRFEG
jgi:hypothetical protein